MCAKSSTGMVQPPWFSDSVIMMVERKASVIQSITLSQMTRSRLHHSLRACHHISSLHFSYFSFIIIFSYTHTYTLIHTDQSIRWFIYCVSFMLVFLTHTCVGFQPVANQLSCLGVPTTLHLCNKLNWINISTVAG